MGKANYRRWEAEVERTMREALESLVARIESQPPTTTPTRRDPWITGRKIAEELRVRVWGGELRPEDPLFAVDNLVREYDVSPRIARKILDYLELESFTEYRGGQAGGIDRGWPSIRMVKSRHIERDEDGYHTGRTNADRFVFPGCKPESTTRPAPPNICAILQIDPHTPVVTHKGIGTGGYGVLRQLENRWLHPDVVAALPIFTQHFVPDTYEYIEEWAAQPISWEEEVAAVTADPDEARLLRLPAGAPLLCILRTSTVTVDGRSLVAEVDDIRMSAELFSLRYSVIRRSAAQWPVKPVVDDTPDDCGDDLLADEDELW